jgi:glycosyltransferase involved in cell wall biosynthesis
MPRFNYIVTIHNKEDLIEQVLTGILISAGENSHIYLVLDGCTDGTESVIDRMLVDWVGIPATKLYAPDVHEIRSLNIALRFVSQEGEGYNILLQDDVLLRERDFEKKVLAIYQHFDGKIGVLSFRHGTNVGLDPIAGEIFDTDMIESVYGYGAVDEPLLPGHAIRRMVCLRSPQCISFKTIRAVGLLNEKYAPCTYDDHDYGLRCLAAGLENVVYALKTSSKVEWGGMRRSPQPGLVAVMKRNRGYVYQDHANFVRSLRLEEFLQPAIRIPVDATSEDPAIALRNYQENKAALKKFARKQRFNFVRRLRERLPR